VWGDLSRAGAAAPGCQRIRQQMVYITTAAGAAPRGVRRLLSGPLGDRTISGCVTAKGKSAVGTGSERLQATRVCQRAASWRG
jgi:hypothetical protein